MTTSEWLRLGALVVQFGAVVVSFSVFIRGLVNTICDWHGSPELKAITEQLETSNSLLKDSNEQVRNDSDKLFKLLERTMDRLDERG